ncbi:hypothetical protein [Neorickettsia sennetsu]|uniref:Uncharacterized protein n=1 Tax=Ehrlichia sennetsu (strain ATCC VR-367 / Miyayama) TaxID=222891 RepID=Q2GCY2_EHRS3|nr:hypothetical protein [Neorickettsia sennetsu]ABD46295.1 hypothetical protein NSE_0789 [Neorickettsia sennetsu str. Miyayama]
MLPTYELKRQLVLSLGDSAHKVAGEVLEKFFGRVESRYIRVRTQNAGVILADILAPDTSTIIKVQIIFEAHAKPVPLASSGQHFGFLYDTTVSVTPSDTFSAWILSRIASQEDGCTPGIKSRYEIAIKNLSGLRRKSQIFGILGIVFCVYFIIAITASIGAALTNNSSLRRYGLPTFIALTAVFAALSIAFAVATFCMKKEIKKANTNFSCVRSELFALHNVSVGELARLCNQYLQEKGMEIELVKPVMEYEEPLEVTSAFPQESGVGHCRPS